MNCPKCNKEMNQWFRVDILKKGKDTSGYTCYQCGSSYLDLDNSDFDGYVFGDSLIEKDNSKYLFVSGSSIDPEEAKVMQVKNMYIKKVTDEGVVFFKVND